jgi:hypothetical protein
MPDLENLLRYRGLPPPRGATIRNATFLERLEGLLSGLGRGVRGEDSPVLGDLGSNIVRNAPWALGGPKGAAIGLGLGLYETMYPSAKREIDAAGQVLMGGALHIPGMGAREAQEIVDSIGEPAAKLYAEFKGKGFEKAEDLAGEFFMTALEKRMNGASDEEILALGQELKAKFGSQVKDDKARLAPIAEERLSGAEEELGSFSPLAADLPTEARGPVKAPAAVVPVRQTVAGAGGAKQFKVSDIKDFLSDAGQYNPELVEKYRNSLRRFNSRWGAMADDHYFAGKTQEEIANATPALTREGTISKGSVKRIVHDVMSDWKDLVQIPAGQYQLSSRLRKNIQESFSVGQIRKAIMESGLPESQMFAAEQYLLAGQSPAAIRRALRKPTEHKLQSPGDVIKSSEALESQISEGVRTIVKRLIGL